MTTSFVCVGQQTVPGFGVLCRMDFLTRFARCKRSVRIFILTVFVLYCHFMLVVYKMLDGLHTNEPLQFDVRQSAVTAGRISSLTAEPTRFVEQVALPFAIWPRNDSDVDGERLPNQLRYGQLYGPTSKLKLIYSEIYLTEENSGWKPFVKGQCPIGFCYIIQKNSRQHNKSVRYDAYLMSGHKPRDLSLTSGGVKIWYQLESPLYSVSPRAGINWTATYRRSSTLRTPYEFFVSNQITNASSNAAGKKPARDYAKGKTKMAAIFMSNCKAKNSRSKLVEELKRYITVDVYGSCGPFRCSKRRSNVCFDILNKEYKFYLAFENSNCRDYITEKFFINGLSNDVIPVVMGAHPDDYRAVAPPHSYIHVDDFESPRHLAEYLKLLDKNDTLYNEYFLWKGTGTFINTKFWCRLCAMLHARDQTNYVHSYPDLLSWWHKDQCVLPNTPYGATWRTKHNSTVT